MPRILIIDDDPQICRTLSKLLGLHGHVAITAADGKTGLVAAGKKPDLIICDLDMPTLNGHGVLAALRQDKRLEEVPFIFFSGCATREQIRQGMNLGGDDFLTKPAEAFEILEAVNARLLRHRRQRQRQEQELKKAVDIFAGVVNDLGTPDAAIQWLAEAATTEPEGKGATAVRVPGAASPAAVPSVLPANTATFLATNAGRQHFVKLSEVKLLLADGEYSKAFWGKDQRMMFRKPLKDWQQELPEQQFVRVHRKAIINLSFLDYVDKTPTGKPQVYLRDYREPIQVSQRKVSALNRSLKGFSRLK